MKPYRGPSEAQANAEALARRSSPYTAASDASFRLAWDVHHREPERLRDAVKAVRRAYADEVPDKLHDSAIGDDGAPRMNARAVGYIFGSSESDDAGRDPESGERDMMGYYFSPFRACLSVMERGTESHKVYAAIVQSITIGGQGPKEAALPYAHEAIAEGVSFMALRFFLRRLTDVRLHVREGADAVA